MVPGSLQSGCRLNCCLSSGGIRADFDCLHFLAPRALVPRLSALETVFMFSWKTVFPWTRVGGWLGNVSSTLYVLCTLFLSLLHKFHLRSSGIRYQIGEVWREDRGTEVGDLCSRGHWHDLDHDPFLSPLQSLAPLITHPTTDS